jgi:hypothetical protein
MDIAADRVALGEKMQLGDQKEKREKERRDSSKCTGSAG